MRKRWSKLPKVVYGAGGSITVREIPQPKADDGEECGGTWDSTTRVIEIEEGLAPRMKWTIFFHELMHATLADSGLVHLLNSDSEEALCDAVATSRVIEMVGRSNA